MIVCVLIMELSLASLLVGWLWVAIALSAWPVPFMYESQVVMVCASIPIQSR